MDDKNLLTSDQLLGSMDDKKLLTRGQFLGVVGSVALGAMLFKFSSVKHLTTALSGKNARATASGAYGNNTYGGKSA
jgi:hypothetical protein